MSPLLGGEGALAPDLPQPQGLLVFRLGQPVQIPPDHRLKPAALQLPGPVFPAFAQAAFLQRARPDSPFYSAEYTQCSPLELRPQGM